MDRFKKMFSVTIQDFKGGITPSLQQIQHIAQSGYNKIKDLPKGVQPLIFKRDKIPTKDIIPLSDRIFWMNFPGSENIKQLSTYLNTQYQDNYFIWNVSEHEYMTEFFQNQVAVHTHPGYPCPPLIEILTICKNILTWLSSDEQNVALVNCQQAKGRSIMILSILIAFLSDVHPAETLLNVCQRVNIQDFKALFPSQHQYLTYCENIMNGLKINTTSLRLVSVVFSVIPTVEGTKEFSPYLQLFSKGKILYNSLASGKIQKYQTSDLNIIFHIDGIEVLDDILIRCRHFESNDKRIPLFRFMFNTGFIFGNVLRVSNFELDVTNNFKASKEFFIDLIFERGHQKSSQHAFSKETPQQLNVQKDQWTASQSFQTVQQLVDDCKHIVSQNQSIQIKIDEINILEQQTQNNTNALCLQKEEIIEQKQELQKDFKQITQIQIEEQLEQNEINYSENYLEKEQSSDSVDSNPQNKQLMQQILSQIDQDQNIDDDEDLNDYLSKLEEQG